MQFDCKISRSCVSLLILLMLIFSISHDAAVAKNVTQNSHDVCLDHELNTWNIIDCNSEEIDRIKSKIDMIQLNVKKMYSTKDYKELLLSQKIWLNSQEKNCTGPDYDQDGQMHRINASFCITEQWKKRLKWMEQAYPKGAK